MGKKIFKGILITSALLIAIWFLGPRAQYEPVDTLPISLDWSLEDIDSIIYAKESQIEHLKDDNEARVVWADSTQSQTPYSIVYIHGFSASQGEGNPVHRKLAQALGANLYLARLRDHGLDYDDAFKDLNPSDLINDTKEAIAIGRLIGEKVILVSCSTGGTLSIALAPDDPSIHSLILMSPNISIKDPNASMVTGPWGSQLIKMLVGEYRLIEEHEKKQYWTGNYHIDGLIALQGLIDQTMTEETFSKIDIPVHMSYYYKNQEEQDQVVSVDAMLDFYQKIGTPAQLKAEVAFANAKSHVICNSDRNPNWAEINESILSFLQPLLK